MTSAVKAYSSVIKSAEAILLQADAEDEATKALKERIEKYKELLDLLGKSQKDAEDNAKKNNPDDPGKIEQYIQQLEGELMDFEGMVVSLAQTIESEFATAMSSAISGIIDGTQTAEEAFANMFKNIGKAFIDMATEMIAKALIMKALGILLPGAGGATALAGPAAGAFSGGFGDFGIAGPDFFGGGMIPDGFADGGFVNQPTMAMVGEGADSEYVIPSSKMDGAMQRWNAGARGAAVVDGADPSEGGGSGGNASPITLNVTATEIGGENFGRSMTCRLHWRRPRQRQRLQVPNKVKRVPCVDCR